jgi:V8-like Glu-specific endopeptidase
MNRLLFAMAIALPFGAQALPLPKTVPAMLQELPETFTNDGYNFEGIVALSNCSGSVIRFETSKDTDNAMVLTNGHCLETGFPTPGQFVANQASSRRFSLYNAQDDTVGTLNATRVIYSSMTKTDITLYALSESYADILSKYNVRPFTLVSTHPTVGTNIQVISGYWNRGYSCSIEAFAHELHEEGYVWQDSVRYSRPGCEVIGGTSGSPVVAADGSRTVVAINNTINEDNEQCTMNNPCEVDEKGNITYHEGYGYAEQTYWIYTCLNKDNQFDLSVDGCLLFH